MRRVAIATIGSIAAILVTGTVAVAATTGLLEDPHPATGQVELVDRSRTAPRPEPTTVTVFVDDPPVVPPAPAPAPVPSPAPAPTAPGRSATDARAATPTTARPVAPPAAAVRPPAPTPSAPACGGSDDGLTEAQKQAREAECGDGHGHESDDD
jgi:hypothetical protein